MSPDNLHYQSTFLFAIVVGIANQILVFIVDSDYNLVLDYNMVMHDLYFNCQRTILAESY